MEHWVEINLDGEVEGQDGILLDVLRPYVRRLDERRTLVTYHYFREPALRFRIRLKTAASKEREARALAKIAHSLVRKGLVTEWHFGSHGESGTEYSGEEDRYGREGWKVAQDYFRNGAETALRLLELKRRSRLENMLWARGLGNPWEGGELNPWKRKEDDPLMFHWSRFVHLFSNQLGFDMGREIELCARQADGYGQVVKEFGMKW
ncbi:MAG TPA: lantibiotic dehydratase C-terminal domain-containing protein [Nitrososphaerales archaeon]|nr:lantibiotic dehydratase C-terminal domain-containing protein [Nitrososphaerales archaeon]